VGTTWAVLPLVLWHAYTCHLPSPWLLTGAQPGEQLRVRITYFEPLEFLAGVYSVRVGVDTGCCMMPVG
jgi:hypothetical protein